MLSLYERTQEIRQATGWSLERIGAETGLGMSTIGRILRIPGYTGNSTSRSLIVQLHEEVVRSPFPRYTDTLFNHYDVWKEQLSKRDFTGIQRTLETLLCNHRNLEENTLEACRLQWLLGHIEYDRSFYLRQDPVRSAARALEWYNKALAVLETQSDKRLNQEKYKLQQCLVSTQYNSCESGKRAESPKIRAWLTQMDYLDLVKTVLQEVPWNWMVARNGLVAASILHEYKSCLFFWQALHTAHKRFRDPHFRPCNDHQAIAEDPDLAWFTKHILKESL